jgi:hypothetical protein
MRNRPRHGLKTLTSVALLSCLAACGGGEEAATPANDTPVAATPAPGVLSADMRAAAVEDHLVPSPGEMQAAMTAANIQASLASLVPDREMDMGSDDKDHIAVRTGVVLADMLLTVESASKEATISRFKQIQAGLQVLKAGDDLPREIDDLIQQIENDSLTGSKLVFELDQLRAAVIPEINYEADWTLPMLQAGAWLEGAHLISKALAGNEESSGTQLLRQPDVVDYFLRYVAQEGEGRAESKVLDTLKATLGKIKEIVSKDVLTAEDISAIHDSTGVVLNLLLKGG